MVCALSIHQLTKLYSNGVQALKGINLDIAPGSFFGLLGPNGAGKTTALGTVVSLVNKTYGKVKVFGIDIDQDFPAAKQKIGFVPQEYNFNIFEKVYDIVYHQAGFYGLTPALAKKNTEIYLKQLHLWDKRHVRSRTLSGGMKRRLMIACAMVHEPELLILDEPTAGVDIEIRQSMWQFLTALNQQGVTIILTTHYLEEAEALCDRFAVIHQGEIIAHDDKAQLLEALHQEQVLLHTQQAFDQIAPLVGYSFDKIADKTLSVSIGQQQSLTELLRLLAEQSIIVQRVQPKRSRLEEVFLSLIR